MESSGHFAGATAPIEAPRWDIEETVALDRVRSRLFGAEEAPMRVARYLLLRHVASGGFGSVHEAYDPDLDRKVAIKLLHARGGETEAEDAAAARLLREARALAKLAHPNVLAVHDVGELPPGLGRARPGVFMVTELVEGETLAQWLAHGRRPWRDVARIFLAAGQGLAAAHAGGLVHRDFKPSNVLIGSDGRVRVADFGLVRSVEAGAGDVGGVSGPSVPARLDPGLTAEGTVVGTPAYMAPEQHAGRPIDERSDQYAFCVALHEALFGQLPHVARELRALAASKAQALSVSAPAGARVPRALYRLVRRGLSPRPEDRWPSMAAVLQQIESVSSRRRRLAIALGSFASLGIVAAVFASRADAAVCAGVADDLDGTWDARVAERLRPHYAGREEAFAEVVGTMDRYRDRWVAARADACMLALDGDAQAGEAVRRRVACLQSRRKAAGEVVSLLERGDDSMLARSAEVTGALPGIPACADDETLFRTGLPVEAEASAAVMDAEAQLVRVRAFRLMDRYAEAMEAARAAVEHGERSGHGPTHARALFGLAWVQAPVGELHAAEQSVRAGWHIAEAGGLGELAMRAVIDLADIVRTRGRLDEAATLVELATAKAKFYGLRDAVTADLDYQRAATLRARGRPGEALPWARAAVLKRRAAFGDSHVAVAWADEELAQVHLALGQLDAAEDALLDAGRIYTGAFGTDADGSLANRLDLAWLEALRGRPQEARAVLAPGCDRLEHIGPHTWLDVVECRRRLGQVELASDRRDQARAQLLAARALVDARVGRDHPIAVEVRAELETVGGAREQP